jgi:hypothetical protein
MVHSVLVQNLILADSCCKTSIARLMMMMMMMVVGEAAVDCFAYMSLVVAAAVAAVSPGQDFDTSKKPCLFHQAFLIKTMRSPLPNSDTHSLLLLSGRWR